MSGWKTYIAGLLLLIAATGLGILHVRGVVPADVAVPIYGGLVPLAFIALRMALAANDAKQADSIKALDDKVSAIIDKLEGSNNEKS